MANAIAFFASCLKNTQKTLIDLMACPDSSLIRPEYQKAFHGETPHYDRTLDCNHSKRMRGGRGRYLDFAVTRLRRSRYQFGHLGLCQSAPRYAEHEQVHHSQQQRIWRPNDKWHNSRWGAKRCIHCQPPLQQRVCRRPLRN